MLSKTCFDRCMSGLLIFADVSIDKSKNAIFYALMKNDFDDREFSEISNDICKTENLYGHYPAPKLFYDRKKQDKSNMVMILEGQFYLDDSIPEYKPYLIGCSDEEQLRIWKWIFDNKYGQEVSKDWIIERIKQFRKPEIEKEPEITYEETKLLISSSVKKIEDET